MQKKIKIDTRVLYKKICFTQPEETNISFHWFQNPPQIIRIEPGSSIIFSSVIQSLQFPPPKINIFATFKNQLVKYPSLSPPPLSTAQCTPPHPFAIRNGVCRDTLRLRRRHLRPPPPPPPAHFTGSNNFSFLCHRQSFIELSLWRWKPNIRSTAPASTGSRA